MACIGKALLEQMASERTCAMSRDPTTSGLMMLCQVIKKEHDEKICPELVCDLNKMVQQAD